MRDRTLTTIIYYDTIKATPFTYVMPVGKKVCIIIRT